MIAEDLLPQNNLVFCLFTLMFGAYGAGSAQLYAPDLMTGKMAAEKLFAILDRPFQDRLDHGVSL